MAHFKKGAEVHVRQYNGTINYREKYRVRSCGKKQAVLDYIRNDEDPSRSYYRSRGNTYYLTPIEEARSRYGNEIPTRIKTDWSQHFVLAGVDGWDAPEN